MTARLEQKMDKDISVTELFIDSEDGKTCICILRLGRVSGDERWVSYSYKVELQLMMNALVKAINDGVIEVVVDGARDYDE